MKKYIFILFTIVPFLRGLSQVNPDFKKIKKKKIVSIQYLDNYIADFDEHGALRSFRMNEPKGNHAVYFFDSIGNNTKYYSVKHVPGIGMDTVDRMNAEFSGGVLKSQVWRERDFGDTDLHSEIRYHEYKLLEKEQTTIETLDESMTAYSKSDEDSAWVKFAEDNFSHTKFTKKLNSNQDLIHSFTVDESDTLDIQNLLYTYDSKHNLKEVSAFQETGFNSPGAQKTDLGFYQNFKDQHRNDLFQVAYRQLEYIQAPFKMMKREAKTKEKRNATIVTYRE